MNSLFETTSRRSPPGQPRRAPQRSRFRRFVRALFNLSLVLVVVASIAVVGLYVYIVEGQDIRERFPDLPENSYVYDSEGEEVGEILASENRRTVSYRDMGEYLPQAVVAIEDRRFREHVGVDFEGLGRAAYTDIRARQVEEGGSTITEQLMKNLYVPAEDRYRVSFWRRFVQASLAFSYERSHSKEDILTTYLNTVYFGGGSYGAEMAAERYFGKSARELDLSEAATLAGFLHAPSTYQPEFSGSVERATERRNEILGLMQGQGMISADQRERAQREPLVFEPEVPPDYSEFDPFMDSVRREVISEVGPDAFERGGLRIRTTLDPDMQREAIESSGEVLYAPGDPSSAVVSIEPQSGAIRAVAGKDGGFNLALDARRQPGSAFKPIVLATALREGISPESLYLSQDLALGSEYVISNYGFIERGGISLYEALAQSDNTVFVRLGMDIGMRRVVDMAGDMGIASALEPDAATAIGGASTSVNPLEMSSAYATLAAGGVYREPYSVERIDRVGFGESDNVYDHSPTGRRVMSGNQAAATTDAMRGVVEYGTASNFHDLDSELGKPSAGKTGTTDDYVDAWYVGYTPRLSTAVWVGFPDGNRSMVGVHGLEEAGGETLPLDLWSLYMARATEDDPDLDFAAPDLTRFRYLDKGYDETLPESYVDPDEVAYGETPDIIATP